MSSRILGFKRNHEENQYSLEEDSIANEQTNNEESMSDIEMTDETKPNNKSNEQENKTLKKLAGSIRYVITYSQFKNDNGKFIIPDYLKEKSKDKTYEKWDYKKFKDYFEYINYN